MPNNTGSALLALAIAAGLTGCQTPKHSDLLVFGTNTQFGVSVSTDATSNPGANIGYKRQELVLMPLFVNARDSNLILPFPGSFPEGKYTGTDGTNPQKSDTYSVLASFGAKGKGDTTGKAEVSLAQTFATGLAARTLAFAGAALVNTGDKAAETAPETAKAAAAAETKQVIAALETSRNIEADLRAKILAHALTDSQLPTVIEEAKKIGLIPQTENVSDASAQRKALIKHTLVGDDPNRLALLKTLAAALNL